MDDDLMRAAGLPSLGSNEVVGFISEVYRNPLLRAHVDKRSATPSSPKLTAEVKKLKSIFDAMDSNPSYDLEKIKDNFPEVRTWVNSKINTELAPLVKIKTNYYPLSIDLRDEAMSRSIIADLCSSSFSAKEIHIVVGAYHVNGIKDRLKKALAPIAPVVTETDMIWSGLGGLIPNSKILNPNSNPPCPATR